jgi:hypothetical protein
MVIYLSERRSSRTAGVRMIRSCFIGALHQAKTATDLSTGYAKERESRDGVSRTSLAIDVTLRGAFPGDIERVCKRQ